MHPRWMYSVKLSDNLFYIELRQQLGIKDIVKRGTKKQTAKVWTCFKKNRP